MFKNSLDEKNFRTLKAMDNPAWHGRKAKSAEDNEDWYSVAFHYAWLLKNEPSKTGTLNALRQAIQELKSQGTDSENRLQAELPKIATEMLDKLSDNELP